jgi:hypothetical protein
MWMNTSQAKSGLPASSTMTFVEPSAVSRSASAQPADPPPTMTTS